MPGQPPSRDPGHGARPPGEGARRGGAARGVRVRRDGGEPQPRRRPARLRTHLAPRVGSRPTRALSRPAPLRAAAGSGADPLPPPPPRCQPRSDPGERAAACGAGPSRAGPGRPSPPAPSLPSPGRKRAIPAAPAQMKAERAGGHFQS